MVGSLGPGLQKWRDHIDSLNIKMDYIETKCRHDLKCLHEVSGNGNFRLMAEQFARAIESENKNQE